MRLNKPTNGTAPARDNGNTREKKPKRPQPEMTPERARLLERRKATVNGGLSLRADGKPPHAQDPITGRILPGAQYDIDPAYIEELASGGSTQEEIARVIGCKSETLHNNYDEAWQRGRARVCQSLRRKQIYRALQGHKGEGDTIMLIWLGKQYLGQTDRLDQRALSFHQHVHTVDEKVVRAMAIGGRTQDVNQLLIDIGAIKALPPMRNNEDNAQPQAQYDATEATVITSRALPSSRVEGEEQANAE